MKYKKLREEFPDKSDEELRKIKNKRKSKKWRDTSPNYTKYRDVWMQKQKVKRPRKKRLPSIKWGNDVKSKYRYYYRRGIKKTFQEIYDELHSKTQAGEMLNQS